jgi:hypothetical protein
MGLGPTADEAPTKSCLTANPLKACFLFRLLTLSLRVV